VSTVARYGWRDPEFWVEVDPDKFAERYVSLDEIMRALADRIMLRFRPGLLRMEEFEYSVRTTGEFETAARDRGCDHPGE
jgi:multidrug efflux pump subunit AcrB